MQEANRGSIGTVNKSMKASVINLEQVLSDDQLEFLSEYQNQKAGDENEVDEQKFEKLALQPDIYCYTFLKYLKIRNPIIQRELTLKCIITFLF